jgi:hypothetical protein
VYQKKKTSPQSLITLKNKNLNHLSIINVKVTSAKNLTVLKMDQGGSFTNKEKGWLAWHHHLVTCLKGLVCVVPYIYIWVLTEFNKTWFHCLLNNLKQAYDESVKCLKWQKEIGLPKRTKVDRQLQLTDWSRIGMSDCRTLATLNLMFGTLEI